MRLTKEEIRLLNFKLLVKEHGVNELARKTGMDLAILEQWANQKIPNLKEKLAAAEARRED